MPSNLSVKGSKHDILSSAHVSISDLTSVVQLLSYSASKEYPATLVSEARRERSGLLKSTFRCNEEAANAFLILPLS